MKVYKSGEFDVKKIEFCCPEMASNLLLGRIETKYWSNEPLKFYIDGYALRHCPSCGAKITGDA